MRTPRRAAVVYDCLFPLTTGGGERQYRAFAEELVDRGVEVDYLTAMQWTSAPPAATFTVVPVSGRLRLYSADGVRRTAAALVFARGVFTGLLRRRTRYDAAIVSGLPVLNVFAARLALLGSRTALVVDYLEVWGREQWVEYAGRLTGNVAWALQRLALTLTPTATCHSQLTARRLRHEGFRRTILVSPGLIDGRDASAVLPGHPASPPYALYAGRHIPDKRVELLPAAVAEARRATPDLRLVITGSGPSSPAVRAAIAAVDGASWTDLPGFVSQEDLDRLMGEASVLVNPSRREGYGLVVVESAAHGTPVVLVIDDGNAATELVEEGVNGYVAASATPADLGGAIAHAVRDGDDLRRTTRDWYREAVVSRTIGRTIEAIVDHVWTAGTSPARTRARK